MYRLLGLDELPEYSSRKRRYEEYIRQERVKFLGIACGADGFSTWQPSTETCAEAETI